MSCDAEFVRERSARLWHSAAHRLAHLLAQLLNFLLQRGELSAEMLIFTVSGQLCRVEGLRALRAIAVDRNALQSQPPSLDINIANFLDRGRVGDIHSFGNCSREEGLRRSHDLQVRAVVEAAFSTRRPEGAIENRQMLRLEAAFRHIASAR